ncbi:CYTH4 [Acrasis kona]|uniref:CYTH4 n=1 Tax=Acrasis kona TaxID=1008807 RepID=A0AAW2YK89_9EUKA
MNFNNPIFCTSEYSKRVHPNKAYDLDSCCDYFNINCTQLRKNNNYGDVTDCILTSLLYIAVIDHYRNNVKTKAPATTKQTEQNTSTHESKITPNIIPPLLPRPIAQKASTKPFIPVKSTENKLTTKSSLTTAQTSQKTIRPAIPIIRSNTTPSTKIIPANDKTEKNATSPNMQLSPPTKESQTNISAKPSEDSLLNQFDESQRSSLLMFFQNCGTKDLDSFFNKSRSKIIIKQRPFESFNQLVQKFESIPCLGMRNLTKFWEARISK